MEGYPNETYAKYIQEEQMKDKKKVKMGKKNRAAGQRFELKVRKDLEREWIVDKWTNNIKFTDAYHHGILPNWSGELVKAKSNRFNMRSCGFPDFVAFRHCYPKDIMKSEKINQEIIGIECKSNGYLSKEEKEKCQWLLDNYVFVRILIAKKGKKRGSIEYVEFKQTSLGRNKSVEKGR